MKTNASGLLLLLSGAVLPAPAAAAAQGAPASSATTEPANVYTSVEQMP